MKNDQFYTTVLSLLEFEISAQKIAWFGAKIAPVVKIRSKPLYSNEIAMPKILSFSV